MNSLTDFTETKEHINNTIYQTIYGFYFILYKNPISYANKTKKTIKAVASLEDIENNTQALIELQNKKQDLLKIELLEKFKPFRSKKFQHYKITANNYRYIASKILTMVNIAKTIRDNSKISTDREFFRTCERNLNTIYHLIESDEFAEAFDIFKSSHLEYINNTADNFAKLTCAVSKINSAIRENDKLEKEHKANLAKLKEKERKIVLVGGDMANFIRLETITRANNMYKEFLDDFLRDVRNQISLSSLDLYKNLIENKIPAFNSQFKMPLSPNVSQGYAEEAIYHLEKLIDYVTLISKNSYTTSVYHDIENDMQ